MFVLKAPTFDLYVNSFSSVVGTELRVSRLNATIPRIIAIRRSITLSEFVLNTIPYLFVVSGSMSPSRQFVSSSGSVLFSNQFVASPGSVLFPSQFVASSGSGLSYSQFVASLGSVLSSSQFVASSGSGLSSSQFVASSGSMPPSSQFIALASASPSSHFVVSRSVSSSSLFVVSGSVWLHLIGDSFLLVINMYCHYFGRQQDKTQYYYK